ncbi:hypothetical protein KXW36_000746, partial [Aspergillus fumigatus]
RAKALGATAPMSSPSNRIRPEVWSSRRITIIDVVDLPQPDSPTIPSVCPAATVRLTPSTARRLPRGVGKSTTTSSTESSVLVSPTRLKESTVRNIAAAGMKASRGARSRLSRPSPIILPQLEIGGGTPRPMNESDPSTTMVMATASRKKANSGRIT